MHAIEYLEIASEIKWQYSRPRRAHPCFNGILEYAQETTELTHEKEKSRDWNWVLVLSSEDIKSFVFQKDVQRSTTATHNYVYMRLFKTNTRFTFGSNVHSICSFCHFYYGMIFSYFHSEPISQKGTKLNRFRTLWLLLLLSPKGWDLTSVDHTTRSVGFAVGSMFLRACTFYFSSLPFALAYLSCHMSNNEPFTGCCNFL